MKYFIQTYGCQMNYSDSERVASVLEGLGYERATTPDSQGVPSGGSPDALSSSQGVSSDVDFLIFNTCSVKQKAEDKVLGLRRELAALKKARPTMIIALTGCMSRKTSTRRSGENCVNCLRAKTEPNSSGCKDSVHRDSLLRRMPELDIVFQIKDVAMLPELIREIELGPAAATAAYDAAAASRNAAADEGSVANYFKIAPSKENAAQVFVPIQAGCDKFCSYCIVPFARGREVSRDFDEILAECRRHAQEGALEITLVGQTVNSYGLSFNDRKSGRFEKWTAEGKSPFAALLREIDKLSALGLKRLRFTSPHPRDFSDELIQTLGELQTICPYIHMPIQSGNDDVLRRMNRNYRTAEFMEIMRKIRAAIPGDGDTPGCAISTDVIVGFCGETDEEFEDTYRMYKEVEWDMCYPSRYSPRKGTYSERKLKDDVPAKVKAKRWHRLNDLLVEIMHKKHEAFVGKTVEVLVEKHEGGNAGNSGKYSGRTPHYKEVFFPAAAGTTGKELIGKIVPVKVTASKGIFLEGELIQAQL